MTKHCLSSILAAIVLIVAISSCVTTSKLTYLQLSTLGDTIRRFIDTIPSVTPSTYKILPNDNIYVRVVTPDPQWSNMFNTLPTTAGIQISPESAQLLSYPVETDGTIELPYLGKFHVEGKTLSEIKNELEISLKRFISDAAVTVRLVNNYISLVGEVRVPGRYPIYKDRMNVFEALSLAGDLGEYSNRQQVQIIRRSANKNIIKEFSLLDRSILSSEFFYDMPNDVIYARPLRGKFFGMNTFPYAILLSSITSFILIFNFVDNLNN
jgi:polysaccharide export outer membrane protein